MALNAVISMGVSFAIQGLISLVDWLVVTNKEAIESANELTEAYREQTKTLSENKKSLKEQKSEFEILSRGVDDYGKNISLSADEYDRYKEIVAEILGYTPELIAGYDEEGNAIANKNGLLERSIELMEEEQRLKLEQMTSDESTKTTYEGAKAEYKEALSKGTDKWDLAYVFDNANYTANERNIVAQHFGIYDEIVNGKQLDKAIADNIDEVFEVLQQGRKSLEEALVNEDGEAIYTAEEIDYLYENLEKWKKGHYNWIDELEKTSHGMDDHFQLFAQKSENYNDLTDAQKNFVTEYIKGTGAIVDAEGNMLSKDEIQKKAKGYTDFVDELANASEDEKRKINTLYSLQDKKDDMSATAYEKQVDDLLEEIKNEFDLTDDVVKEIKVGLGFEFVEVDGKETTSTQTLLTNVQKKLDDQFDEQVNDLTIDDLQIAGEVVAKLDDKALLSWEELTNLIKEAKKEMGVGNPNGLLPAIQKVVDELENYNGEWNKLHEWGLGDYEEQIKNGTAPTKFGNIDMDDRTVITWTEELKQKYKDALDSWEYNPEIGSIDTVFGGYEKYGKYTVEFTPILPDGTFLSRDTVDKYINQIISSETNGKLTYDIDGDEIISNAEILQVDSEGLVIDGVEVKGIVGRISEGEDEDWIHSIGTLPHFVGRFGAITQAFEGLNGAIDKISPEALTSEIDGLQSAFQTVQGAIEEYNESGILTVDTFQSLMDLHPEYLRYLMDENGNLTLNTETMESYAASLLKVQAFKQIKEIVDYVASLDEEERKLYLTKQATDMATASLSDYAKALIQAKVVSGTLSEEDVAGTMTLIEGTIKQYESAVQGISKGGLGKVTDTAKKALDALKNKFDKLELSIKKVDNAIKLLQNTFDLTFEDDYIAKIGITNRQFDLATEKANLLKNEFAQLRAEEVTNAETANELASRMQSVADNIFENQKSIREYAKNISVYYTSALTSVSALSKETASEATNLIDRNIKVLSEGGLMGLSFDLTPTLPQSAIEKQREENEQLEAEMQAYYDTIAQMQKVALDLQAQETAKSNAQQISTQKQTNETTTEEQKKDFEEKEQQTQGFVDNTKDIIGGLNTWMDENPIKAPELDKTAWENLVKDVEGYVSQITSSFGNSKTASAGDYGNGLQAVADAAKAQTGYKTASENKNIFSAYAKEKGWTSTDTQDWCADFVSYAYNIAGYDIHSSDARDLVSKMKKIDTPMIGATALFSGEGNQGHVELVTGFTEDGKPIFTGGNVGNDEVKTRTRGGVLGYYVPYAKGTHDYGIAGENYKKEWAINKKTGEWTKIESPTLFDKSKFDIVGEKVSEKLPEPIPTYAKGTIKVPDGLGSSHSYTQFNEDGYLGKKLGYWDKDSKSWQLFQKLLATGELTVDQNGIYMYRGMRLAATTNKYGSVGDVMKVNQEGAEPYYIIKMDTKRTSDAGATQDGHGGGHDVVEFEVKKDAIAPEYKSAGGTPPYGDLNHNISSIENLGNIFEDSSLLDNVSSIAGNVDKIARQDLKTRISELIKGESESPNKAQYEDEIMSYIRANLTDRENVTNDFLASWENLQAHQKANVEIFKGFEQQLVNSLGTDSYASISDTVSDAVMASTGETIKAQTDISAQYIKDEFERAQEASDLILDYYYERRDADATADELNEIRKAYAENSELVKELSDEYVSAMQAYRDFKVALAGQEMQSYDDSLSWQNKMVEDLEDKYDRTEDPIEKEKIGDQIIKGLRDSVAIEQNKKTDAENKLSALYADDRYADILDQFDPSEWFNADGELTAQFEAHKAMLVAQDDQEAVVRMIELAETAQVYNNAIIQADDNMQNLGNSIKDAQLEEANQKIELQAEVYDKINKRLNVRLDKEKAITSALEQQNSFQQKLRDEALEYESELIANKHLEAYLDPQAKELLFNDADYQTMIDEIDAISAEALEKYETYQKKIAELGDQDYYKEQKLTEQYNQQMEVLEEKLETKKKELEVTKKNLEYNNTLKERDTRVILGGRTINIADPEKLYNIELERSKAEKQLDNYIKDNAENQVVRDMEMDSAATQEIISANEKYVETLQGLSDEEKIRHAETMASVTELTGCIHALSMDYIPFLNEYEYSYRPQMMSFSDVEWGDGYDSTYDHADGQDSIWGFLESIGAIPKSFANKMRTRTESQRNNKVTSDPVESEHAPQTTEYGGKLYSDNFAKRDVQQENYNNFSNQIKDIMQTVSKENRNFTEAELNELRRLETLSNRESFLGDLGHTQTSQFGGIMFNDQQSDYAEAMGYIKDYAMDGLTADDLNKMNNQMSIWETRREEKLNQMAENDVVAQETNSGILTVLEEGDVTVDLSSKSLDEVADIIEKNGGFKKTPSYEELKAQQDLSVKVTVDGKVQVPIAEEGEIAKPVYTQQYAMPNEIASAKYSPKKYASGTKSATGGLSITDEEGYEAKLRKLTNGNYVVLKPEDMVLSKAMTDNLWDFGSNPTNFLSEQMKKLTNQNIAQIHNIANHNDNSTVVQNQFSGDIVVTETINNANELFADVFRQTSSRYDITKNMKR